MELRIAKVNSDLWSNFVQSNEQELNKLINENIEKYLKRFGAVEFGKRELILSDNSNRKNQIGVIFPEDNIEVPFVAYAITRPLAMVRRGQY
jgi:hypothetical protein